MGCEDPKDNALRVRLGIIGLRLVPNTIAVLSDKPTLGLIEPIAVSAGAATGGIAYYPVKFGLILAIATAESAFDAYQLCDGYMIKLIKGPTDTIIGSGFKTLITVMGDRLSGTNINIEDLKKATNSSSRDTAPSIPEKSSITLKKEKVPGLDLAKKEDLELAEKPEKAKQTPSIKVDYEDHLRFMLFMMDLTGNRDSKIRSVQDVVQINLGLDREGFTLEKVATFLRLKVNATIKSIFFGESAGDMTNSTDNAEYYKNRRDLEVEIMHGY